MSAADSSDMNDDITRRRSRRLADFAGRDCLWICKTCSYSKNKDDAAKCEICGTDSPQTRFERKINGKDYLISIKRRSSTADNDILVLVEAHPTSDGGYTDIRTDDAAKCEICGTDSPQTRFERKINGKDYLISIKRRSSTADNDILVLVEAHPTSDGGYTDKKNPSADKIEIVLDTSVDDLTDRLEKTLADFEAANHTLAVPSSSTSAHQAEVSSLPSSAIKPNTHKRRSTAKRRSMSAKSKFLATFTRPFLLEETAQDGEAKKGKDGQRELFDAVIASSRGQVYDTVLGSFLPRDHPIVVASVANPLDIGAHPIYGFDGDFSYVQDMVKEKGAMANKLKQEANRRHQCNNLRDDYEEQERLMDDRKKKSRAEMLSAARDCKTSCALCENRYHSTVLMGLVPFKAVVRWREKHGAPIDAKDRRLTPGRIYENAAICVFCNQLFDENFGDYVSYHRGKTSKDDSVLLLEGNQEGSLIDPHVTERLRAFVSKKKSRSAHEEDSHSVSSSMTSTLPSINGSTNAKRRRRRGGGYPHQYQVAQGGELQHNDFSPDGRPESRIKFEMAICNLRAKRGQPLLMSEIGCELARHSYLQEVDRRKEHGPLEVLERLGRRNSTSTMKASSTSSSSSMRRASHGTDDLASRASAVHVRKDGNTPEPSGCLLPPAYLSPNQSIASRLQKRILVRKSKPDLVDVDISGVVGECPTSKAIVKREDEKQSGKDKGTVADHREGEHQQQQRRQSECGKRRVVIKRGLSHYDETIEKARKLYV